MKRFRVAGYIKLAKLWERSKDQAMELHRAYYEEKFADNPEMELQEVYVDITGNKHIYKRKEMVRLLRDCRDGKIDLITTPTRAYLAANSEHLCFLLKFLFDLPNRIDIVTDDDDRKIDTVQNIEKQTELLKKMAENYVAIQEEEYNEWKKKLLEAMNSLA